MRSIFFLAIAAFGCAGADSDANLAEWRRLLADSGPLYDQGHFREAARTLEKAVHCAERFPALDPRLPTTIHALAFMYQEHGDYAEATGLYLRAIQLWEKIGPSRHAALLKSTDNLIGTYMAARNYRAATKLLMARLPEMERSAVDWRDRATLLDTRSGVSYIGHDYGEAERLLRESLALWEQHVPQENGNLAIVLMNLSHVIGCGKRYQEALDLELRAIAVLDERGPDSGSLTVRALDTAATLCMKLGRAADAERYEERAVRKAREVFGPDDPVSARVMLGYAQVLRALQRGEEAKILARDANDVLRRGEKLGTVDVLSLAPTH